MGMCSSSITPMAIIKAPVAYTNDIKTIVLYIPNRLSAVTAPTIAKQDATNEYE